MGDLFIITDQAYVLPPLYEAWLQKLKSHLGQIHPWINLENETIPGVSQVLWFKFRNKGFLVPTTLIHTSSPAKPVDMVFAFKGQVFQP